MDLSQYKDVFGAPGTGAHKHRIAGMAAVDLVATLVAAVILAAMLPGRQPLAIGFAICAAGLMALAVCVHLLFGVKTALNVAMFGPRQ